MKLKRTALIPILLITAGVALAACGSSSDSGSDPGSDADSGQVEVTDVWARSSAPGQTTSAIYATLQGGDRADRLTAVAVPPDVAGRAEVHETVAAGDQMADGESEGHMESDPATDDHMGSDQTTDHGADHMAGGEGPGNMMMKQVHAVEVPAGKHVMLEPGGLHIMLFDLAGPLKAGETVPVTLTFEQAGQVKVDATVRDE